MTFFPKLLYISIGMLIALLLVKYTNLSMQYMFFAGALLFIVAIIASLLNRKAKTFNLDKTTKLRTDNANTVAGTVKWFNNTKGFGFITKDDGEDVFVHKSALASRSASLRDGQNVTMQIVVDSKGPQAENVRLA